MAEILLTVAKVVPGEGGKSDYLVITWPKKDGGSWDRKCFGVPVDEWKGPGMYKVEYTENTKGDKTYKNPSRLTLLGAGASSSPAESVMSQADGIRVCNTMNNAGVIVSALIALGKIVNTEGAMKEYRTITCDLWAISGDMNMPKEEKETAAEELEEVPF